MARVLLCDEELAIENQRTKELKSKRAFIDKRHALFVSVAIITFIIILPILIQLVHRNTQVTSPVSSIIILRGEGQTTGVSLDDPLILTERPPTPVTTIMISSTAQTTRRLLNAVNNKKIMPLPTNTDKQHILKNDNSHWMNSSPLENWKAFLNVIELATNLPPKLEPSHRFVIDEHRHLYLEMHDGEYCTAVLSFPEAFVKPRSESNNLKQHSTHSNDELFAKSYRKLPFNLTVTSDLYLLNLKIISDNCEGLPVIPIRQIKALPPGKIFLDLVT
ncbi:uncharacterized protein LOC111250296 isoform X1 [Varroa destructor]|uniref:Uncharacterized protein n=1 Tax=Varroa destructor TaxID=109461 RepID=A0A7M7K388_VARDE|nr:uncharacterized protein LOC111250296 isoform X1 [Varroa destructor]